MVVEVVVEETLYVRDTAYIRSNRRCTSEGAPEVEVEVDVEV